MSSSRFRKKWLLPFLLVPLALALVVLGGAGRALADPGPTLFELDGNAVDNSGAGLPDDWANIFSGPNGALASIFIGASTEAPGNDITFFTGGGSKDVNDISQWRHSPTDVAPDKDQILDAGAAVYSDGTNRFLYLMADRFDTSGDAQVGF